MKSTKTYFASRDGDHSGFSRIELFVVIVTLAILATALLPALARAHVNSQGGQCLNNLRQLTAGWWMYVNDNQGKLAPNRGLFPANQDYAAYPKWVAGDMHGGIIGGAYTGIDATNSALLVDPRYSQLGAYVKTPALYRCPADLSTLSTSGTPGSNETPRVRSYSMSQAIGPLENGQLSYNGHIAGHWLSSGNATTPGFPWRVYIKESDLVAPTPSQLWVMLEEHPDFINDSAFAVQMPPNPGFTEWIDLPAKYHNNACDFSFADGHAESHLWQDPSAIPVTVWAVDTASSGGGPFSVPNDPDVLWLAHRTSALAPGAPPGIYQP
jgi:prepilin-type processing-associated H-X9-DG protein